MPKKGNRLLHYNTLRLPANNTTKLLHTPDGIPVRCLFVKNIPRNAPPCDIRNMFVNYGTIKNFFLHMGKNSVYQNTYAFITFETPEEAYRAYLSRSSIKYKYKKLYISIADSWHQPITAPDGTINYNPRLTNRKEDTETNDEKEEDEDEEADYNTVEINNIEDCPIAKLNDDCLLHIIEFIPFSDRHILSRVCSRLRNLMMTYWSKITELNFNNSPFDEMLFSEKHLKLYLRLCPNITSVHLGTSIPYISSHYVHPSSSSVITTANLCKNLEELVLEGIPMPKRTFAFVAHSCRCLKSLTIKNCEFQRDDEFNLIMKKCTKLESLSISSCTLFPSNWLKNLRSGLKSLSLLTCVINPQYLSQGLANLRDSLEEFEFVVDVRCFPFDFKYLHNFSKLKSIVYVNGTMKYQKTSPNMFDNLKHLELECNNFVSDSILQGIVEHSPNLVLLNLARSKHTQLTTDGYKKLAKLTDLESLNLSVNQINDEILETIAQNNKNIEVLWLKSCSAITDTGCKRIVSNLMNLKELHLDGCSKVTNKTVDAAVEAAIQKPDKAKLTIHCAETGITEVQIKSHSKVEVSFSNRTLCSWLIGTNITDFLVSLDDLDEDDYDFDIYDDNEFIDSMFDSDDFDYDDEFGNEFFCVYDL